MDNEHSFGRSRKPQPVTTFINEDELPVYEQAAGLAGYQIRVTARAGERAYYSHSHINESNGKWVPGSRITSEGEVHIEIASPDPSVDHGPFWTALKYLQANRLQVIVKII